MNVANLAKIVNGVFCSCSLNFIGLILYSFKKLLEVAVDKLLPIAKHGERVDGRFVGGLAATGALKLLKVRPSPNSFCLTVNHEGVVAAGRTFWPPEDVLETSSVSSVEGPCLVQSRRIEGLLRLEQTQVRIAPQEASTYIGHVRTGSKSPRTWSRCIDELYHRTSEERAVKQKWSVEDLSRLVRRIPPHNRAIH